MADETLRLAISKLSDFIRTLVQRMDFELAGKNNPRDENGNVLEGRYQVLQVYVRSGKYAKNKFADIILKKLGDTEKALSTKAEEPIERGLRDFIAGRSVLGGPPTPEVPNIPISTALTPAVAGPVTATAPVARASVAIQPSATPLPPAVPKLPPGAVAVPYGFYTYSVNGRPYAEILPATNTPYDHNVSNVRGMLDAIMGGLQWDINNVQGAIDRGVIATSGLASWNASGGTAGRLAQIEQIKAVSTRVGSSQITDSDVSFVKGLREFSGFSEAQIKSFLMLSPVASGYALGPITPENSGGVYVT